MSTDTEHTFAEETAAPPAVAVDAPEPQGSFLTLLKEAGELELARREHEDKLKVISERWKQIEPILLDQFADSGMQNARAAGLTFYIRTDRYCSKKGEFTSEQVCQCLTRNGLGYMVADSYNAASLKSKFKEWSDGNVEPPADLVAMMNLGEVSRLATRK